MKAAKRLISQQLIDYFVRNGLFRRYHVPKPIYRKPGVRYKRRKR